MISEFNPDYDPRAEYRFITFAEYQQDTFSKENWCNPEKRNSNMNFLFGVDISQDLASRIYENTYLKGSCYNLNPEHLEANNQQWTIYKEFLRKKETKELIKISSIL